MKKKLLVLGIVMVSVFGLTACGHKHTFAEATCTTPKTCTECGETEGELGEHSWVNATDYTPIFCSNCNKIMTADEWIAIDGNKERLEEKNKEVLADSLDYLSDIKVTVENNTYNYMYFYTEEISSLLIDDDIEALNEYLESQDPENICDLLQEDWGVGDAKVKFAYYTYDGTLLCEKLYER